MASDWFDVVLKQLSWILLSQSTKFRDNSAAWKKCCKQFKAFFFTSRARTPSVLLSEAKTPLQRASDTFAWNYNFLVPIYIIRRVKLFVILADNHIKTQNFPLLFQNVGAVHPFINLNNNLAFAKLLWVPVELHTVVASNSPDINVIPSPLIIIVIS